MKLIYVTSVRFDENIFQSVIEDIKGVGGDVIAVGGMLKQMNFPRCLMLHSQGTEN